MQVELPDGQVKSVAELSALVALDHGIAAEFLIPNSASVHSITVRRTENLTEAQRLLAELVTRAAQV